MKKRFKSLLLAGASGLMVFTLASCGGETRNTSVTTSAIRGVFKNQEVKNEFLSMI